MATWYFNAGLYTEAKTILEKLKRSDQADLLYKKILDYLKDQPESTGSITGIKVLTLQKTGHLNEADKILSKWNAVKNNELVFNWISLIFRDQLNDARDLAIKNWTSGEGTPWNPVSADPDFRLVYETLMTITKN